MLLGNSTGAEYGRGQSSLGRRGKGQGGSLPWSTSGCRRQDMLRRSRRFATLDPQQVARASAPSVLSGGRPIARMEMWARIGIRSLASWEMSPLKARGDAFERVRVFDLDFVNAANIDPVCETILQDDPGTLDVAPVVVTPNTDILLQYRQTPDEGFRSFFSSAWLILPDGQPIVCRGEYGNVLIDLHGSSLHTFANIFTEGGEPMSVFIG